ncbi:MAG TPA: pirin family protein [Mycobacteriales bacterium]|nr:pirin family protein [Mycobacteriales bacterium]
MSGPVTVDDAPPVPDCGHPGAHTVEVTESHEATVGRLKVRRALPRRGRRTVGAWCFADHMGPASVTEDSGLDVGPHPHIGLQTVTWLLDGEALHRDSLGSEQVIRPGQLNLMTAGNGVSHSEEATGHYRGELEGIQLWIAQPDRTRGGAAGFEHHRELPRQDFTGGVATVLVGEFAGVTSPARHDSPLAGVELDLPGGTAAFPLRREWEYAAIVLRGSVRLGQHVVEPGHLAYLGDDRDELELEAAAGTRALLLGGEPFAEQIVMWWNFVARDRDELLAAYRSWRDQDDRFGHLRSPLPRIPAPAPYWRS